MSKKREILRRRDDAREEERVGSSLMKGGWFAAQQETLTGDRTTGGSEIPKRSVQCVGRKTLLTFEAGLLLDDMSLILSNF